MVYIIYHVHFPGLGLNFNINPVAFSIGSYDIMWYGVIIATGFLLALLYAIKFSKLFGLDSDKLINAVLVGIVTGIIGARLYYVIFYPGDTFKNNPLEIFQIHQGGLAIYGGIIGGLLGGLIIAKLEKLNLKALLDISALGFLIGQGIGRWGNFTNQEAFGSPTDVPWRMISEGTAGIAVHPCFLYESIWCLLGFLILHIISRKYRKYDGQIFLLYIVWYGAERFVVEGLRTDSLYLFNSNIKVSQALALLCVIVGIVLLIVFKNKDSISGIKPTTKYKRHIAKE